MTDLPTGLSDGAPAEIRELRRKLDQAAARERLLERRLNQVERELAAVYRSRSWHFTAPMRAVLKRLDRLPMRARSRRTVYPAGVSVRALSRAKEALRGRLEAELNDFLGGSDRLGLANASAPRVSILLVLFNQAPLTLACLRAIAATVRLPAEVLIIDNASSDQTGAVLDRLDGAHIVRNAENRHYLHGVNQAAAVAKGETLLLLNNDACLREGSLDAAVSTLFGGDDIGAVGGPIVLPDGTLQEAGSIIWSDGSCLGYGRGADPAAPEFQFVREVDYCSAAFLAVRRASFEALGGFDTAFAPAYYEETDFCMRLRASGWRVVYEPRAAVDHFEFASSRTSEAALALQRRNHATFVERHRAALAAEHWPPGTPALVARMRGRDRGRVLVIEDRVPFASLGAGYPRAGRLLKALVADRWFVTFYPLLCPEDAWDEIRAELPATVEVMLGSGQTGLRRFLQERQGYYQTIVVSRPHNLRCFLDACDRNPRARLVYDAEAVFASREFARLSLAGTPVPESRRRAMLHEEMQLARTAHTVVTVSERDAGLFRSSGCADVQVLGHALVPLPTMVSYEARGDLLFVGALDDDPSPNTDSLIWFTSEVMPRLDRLIGTQYRLLVAGRCGAERVTALAGPRVRLLGRVEDLTPLYGEARLFIAPTRFSAGIPHKIHEAAARGLPVVATSLLAGQLGWQDGHELLVADTPDTFAAACARLYEDAALWEGLRGAAMARLTLECDPGAFTRRVADIMRPSARVASSAHRSPALSGSDPVVVKAASPVRRSTLARAALSALVYLRANGLPATSQRLLTELRNRFGRHDYATWVRLYDTLRPADRLAIERHIQQLVLSPIFSLTMVVDSAVQPEAVRRTVASVSNQLYQRWHLCIVDRGAWPEITRLLQDHAARDERVRLQHLDEGTTSAVAGNSALALSTSDFVAAIGPGDMLRPHTLYMLAVACDADPDAGLIYSDEDTDDGTAAGRRDPLFKPDWSPELLLGPDVVGGIRALRRDVVERVGGYREGFEGLAEYDLLLRASERIDPAAIRHIPRILYHCGYAKPAMPADPLRRALAGHVERLGEPAEIEIADDRVRVAVHLLDPPPVSVVIPTRDQPALLRRCVQGVLETTDYPRLEVLIVDNDSRDPATHRLLRQWADDGRVRILPFLQSFNYAAMNNLAVAQARGEIVALLNNDIAVRHPEWLAEMVAHALRAGVGAVGAKLYYDDGTIQHAGVVMGIHGVAGHPFRRAGADTQGPGGRLTRVQTVSCVTAACMVLRREVFDAVGGFDEINLPVSYNDVDLCLRLREAGYRIVWTPHAELDHLESVTRGSDGSPENIERAEREWQYMQRRWAITLEQDPFYNPNLTLAAEDFGLAFPPRVAWPWRSAGASGRY